MKIIKTLLISLSILTIVSTPGNAIEYFLRADETTKTMPDGNIIPMWGFALDSSFGALDGNVTVPGPILSVPPGDSNLIIHFDNDLNVPASIVINGQIANMTPVRNPDGRAHSFTHETQPGNTDPCDYIWTNFRDGTYIYQSGTHVAVQVQMGLYGGVIKDFNVNQAYSGVDYNISVPLFFSEIDPVLHNAVADNNYGTGKLVTSTINYEPKYFLINGQSFSIGAATVPAGNPNDVVLLRFFNMGLETRSPVFHNAYMKLVAEDGQAYQYPKQQYSIFLAAGKTIDALVTLPDSNVYPIYDRRLGLTNSQTTGGGMLAHLEASGTTLPPAALTVSAIADTILDTQTTQLSVNVAVLGQSSPLRYNWKIPKGAGSLSSKTIRNPVYTPPDITGSQTFPLVIETSDGSKTVISTLDINVIDGLIFSANFNKNCNSFEYLDNTFKDTKASSFESGSRVKGGITGRALKVKLGGKNKIDIAGMSGGWQRDFDLSASENVKITFMYNLTQSPNYEDDEYSDILLSIDGVLKGIDTNDYITRIYGDGDGGNNISTGWQQFTATVPLSAGKHSIVIGGYNNKKTDKNEVTTAIFDDIVVERI